jgi:hypothetical protein
VPEAKTCTALAVALAVALSADRAQARNFVRLQCDNDGARVCPDGDALGTKVAERLGYNPFRSDAEQRVTVVFAQRDGKLHAAVKAQDARGTLIGERGLDSDDDSCAELSDSVALTITILVDAPNLGAPPTVPVVAPEIRSDAPPASEPRAAVTAPRLVPRLGMAALLSTGSAPSPAAGFTIFAGARRGPWSVGLGGRADLPASDTFASGGVRTSLRVGELVPCAHLGVGFGCAVLGLGAISAEGFSVPAARHLSAFYAHAGARLGAEVPVVSGFALRASVDLLAPITRTTVAIGNEDAFTTPVVSLTGGLGLVVLFP